MCEKFEEEVSGLHKTQPVYPEQGGASSEKIDTSRTALDAAKQAVDSLFAQAAQFDARTAEHRARNALYTAVAEFSAMPTVDNADLVTARMGAYQSAWMRDRKRVTVS